jgi:tetratricopeptide (TPR) repeat protein
VGPRRTSSKHSRFQSARVALPLLSQAGKESASTSILRAEAWHTITGEKDAPDTGMRLVQARGDLLIGETELAEEHLNAAMGVSPENPAVWEMSAALCEQRGDFGRAESAWQRAIDLAGDDPLLLVKRGEFYSRTTRWDLAKEDWRKAVTLDPGQAYHVFQIIEKAERWRDAVEFGLMHVEQNSDDWYRWLRVAPVVLLTEDKSKYSEYCARMLSQFSDNEDDDRKQNREILLTPVI